jgi:hypothetical protein
MEIVGLLIAAGLGFWAYSDAKNLDRRAIRVGSFSPAAWGWLVALVAIVFGILYLVQRPKAIAAAPLQCAAPSTSTPDAVLAARYCTSCGTHMRSDATYCPGCGLRTAEEHVR